MKSHPVCSFTGSMSVCSMLIGWTILTREDMDGLHPTERRLYHDRRSCTSRPNKGEGRFFRYDTILRDILHEACAIGIVTDQLPLFGLLDHVDRTDERPPHRRARQDAE